MHTLSYSTHIIAYNSSYKIIKKIFFHQAGEKGKKNRMPMVSRKSVIKLLRPGTVG